MPKRTDLSKILVFGSGPIVIGQACEFDYSGTQAIKALKEEGYSVVLLNSNPATIMTDPELADRVYLEPLTVEYAIKVIERERPDGLLPTMGGQTALNLTMALHKLGIFEKYGIRLLGANPESIFKAEDRETFKRIMDSIGVQSAKSKVARSLDDGRAILREFGLPLILRPSFTLGGEGGGAAFTETDFLSKLERALFLSPTKDCLIEESLLGWKEYELEVVRDRTDNAIIICSIENFDPMGIHTGDSITVAPAQTLTDREYQDLRNQSLRIIRAIGVETGGSNIQFAMNPKDGRIIVIEMNPRVSRSSALASKATGFPIARVATKLAIGYTLDELKNDITKHTPSSFEPSIDYVVTKIPRFDFEKFKPSPAELTTQMKSVGETMAMGRTFTESLCKALSGLETAMQGLEEVQGTDDEILNSLRKGSPSRIYAIGEALRRGMTVEKVHTASKVDPWFLDQILKIILMEKEIQAPGALELKENFLKFKRMGFSDYRISQLTKLEEAEVRKRRKQFEIVPSYLKVDTCAAEFEALTPYLYSSYRSLPESQPSSRKKVIILGGGPNRIGQGIEFDYCCVHATQALREMGIETIMVNSNPETVSTDFDTSDKLYFEPLTSEHLLNIVDHEQKNGELLGVIVQFGGQTPLKLAHSLSNYGVPLLGTSLTNIDAAEDRKKCEALVKTLLPLGLEQPPASTATTIDGALTEAKKLGYPILIRPSYVLGGRGMRVIHSENQLKQYIEAALLVSDKHPVLLDRFLDRATEVDVDALSDGETTLVAGLMEHIEEAGIHSGDSSSSLPVFTLPQSITDRIRTYTRELARLFQVKGLMNLQFAIQGNRIFLLEINPRASRTVPFVSKSIGKPIAKIAAKIMVGTKLKDLGLFEDLDLNLESTQIKASVFPFSKFPGVDVLLGPEMKSTGEVIGRGANFAQAFAKACAAAGMQLPSGGKAFLSIRDEDKASILPIAQKLTQLGFELWATQGTAEFLNRYYLNVRPTLKAHQGTPNCVEQIRNREFNLVINTASDEVAIRDSFEIRRATLEQKTPYSTVISSARAMVQAIDTLCRMSLPVKTIRESYYLKD